MCISSDAMSVQHNYMDPTKRIIVVLAMRQICSDTFPGFVVLQFNNFGIERGVYQTKESGSVRVGTVFTKSLTGVWYMSLHCTDLIFTYGLPIRSNKKSADSHWTTVRMVFEWLYILPMGF